MRTSYFKNFLASEYGKDKKINAYEFRQAMSKWKKMSPKQREKYHVIQKDGSVNLLGADYKKFKEARDEEEAQYDIIPY